MAAPWVMAAAGAVLFCITMARFFPNASGRLGYDYGLFLPWFTGGYFWQAVNGPFVAPEYLPSFCGGIPFLFNPQSVYWSLPQMLMAMMPTMAALLVSWITFGLAGAAGMFVLARRTFGASTPASLLAATIFLLNGFYISRMIVGHVTFHGVMLLPLIAALLFSRSERIVARCAGSSLLLAYLFYSGGTNTILPMLLAFTAISLLLALQGKWHRGILSVIVISGLLWIALCAYKLFPALAFADNIVRPVSLRMTGNLVALIGSAGMALFAPQALAWIPGETLVLDRPEFEYGVGIAPLLTLCWGLCAAIRRKDLGPLVQHRLWLLLALAALLALPILLNWDAMGLRWLVLHLPVVKMMSVMLRFWFAYVPLLCVLTAVLLDYLVAQPARRAWWASGAMALTIVQAASTDMEYYAAQSYDPTPLLAAQARVAAGGAVPSVSHVADPWDEEDRRQNARNDALVDGISAYPCYEPMFGYRMEVFPKRRLATGPVLETRDGLFNLKNPACYVFPAENQCRPGDEFTAAQKREAEAFRSYRPFAHARPLWQRLAEFISAAALFACLAGLAYPGIAAIRRRRG